MLPVLDLGVVYALAVDLQSPREALDFLDRFQADLSERVHTIHDAFASLDTEQAAAALTSLRTHALMVGALQLHAITGDALANVDHDLRWGGAGAPAGGYRFLQDLATETALFVHACSALRSNPTLLDPPKTSA